jgi:FkbM family methyltransferase
MFSIEERVALATRCRDCDVIPKISDAGAVFSLPGRPPFQLMHNGIRVVADGYYGKWMTDLIRLCRGHHEIQEERLFHEVIKWLPADATMIELGGFWAYYSLWFLQHHPRRRSVVIEPEPTHLAVGRANAALNGLAPSFHAGFAAAERLPSVPFRTEVSGTLDLPCYAIADLMEIEELERLTLLHCDTQGAETEVIRSSRDLFEAGKIDWVFVSTHAHQISGDPLTHQRCLEMLRSFGAVIEAEHDVHESFSGDGLIVARFCPPPAGWQPVELSYCRHGQSLFRHLAFDLAEKEAELAALRLRLKEVRG